MEAHKFLGLTTLRSLAYIVNLQHKLRSQLPAISLRRKGNRTVVNDVNNVVNNDVLYKEFVRSFGKILRLYKDWKFVQKFARRIEKNYFSTTDYKLNFGQIPSDRAIKRVKNTLCWCFSYIMDQELPCERKEALLDHINMKVMSKLRNEVRHKRKRAIGFAYSIQNLKYLITFEPKDLIKSTLEKHRADLSKPIGDLDPQIKEAYDFILQKFMDFIASNASEIDVFPEPTESRCHSKTGKSFKEAFMKATSEHTSLCSNYHIRVGDRTLCVPDTNYNKDFNFVHGDCLLNNTVKAVALVEPLKVRVITKEAAWTHMLKPIQKLMHSALTHHDFGEIFCLTRGKPYENVSLGILSDSEFYLSGDFSAATDNIHPHFLSEFRDRMRVILKDHPMIWHALNSEARNHIIEYPLGIPPVEQMRGQLMGSLLSFPILCLSNLAIVLASCREHRNHTIDRVIQSASSRTGYKPIIKKVEITISENWSSTLERLKSSCLINGDDLAIRTNDQFLSKWKVLSPNAGFTLSIGKNFIDKRFYTINSKLFIDDKIFPTHKFKCSMSNKGDLASLGAEYPRFFKTEGVQQEVIDKHNRTIRSMFIKDHHKRLMKDPRSLEVPRHLGGLGFGNLIPCNIMQKLTHLIYSYKITKSPKNFTNLLSRFGLERVYVPRGTCHRLKLCDYTSHIGLQFDEPTRDISPSELPVRIRQYIKLVKTKKLALTDRWFHWEWVIVRKFDLPIINQFLVDLRKLGYDKAISKNMSYIGQVIQRLPTLANDYAKFVKRIYMKRLPKKVNGAYKVFRDSLHYTISTKVEPHTELGKATVVALNYAVRPTLPGNTCPYDSWSPFDGDVRLIV